MHKSHAHPQRNQAALRRHNCRKQRDVRIGLQGSTGVMTRDGVIGKPPHRLGIPTGGKKLEGAHTNMTSRHPRHHRPGQSPSLAPYRLAGQHHRKRPRGGNTQGRHRLGYQIFPQHRANRGLAIATA